jgi:hypothetical protein
VVAFIDKVLGTIRTFFSDRLPAEAISQTLQDVSDFVITRPLMFPLQDWQLLVLCADPE